MAMAAVCISVYGTLSILLDAEDACMMHEYNLEASRRGFCGGCAPATQEDVLPWGENVNERGRTKTVMNREMGDKGKAG